LSPTSSRGVCGIGETSLLRPVRSDERALI
jgi:hypothetical protein